MLVNGVAFHGSAMIKLRVEELHRSRVQGDQGRLIFFLVQRPRGAVTCLVSAC
jgi:hypothetical protein